MLRGDNNERPYDKYLRNGYYEPIYDYNEKGVPQSEDPKGFRYVFGEYTVLGMESLLLQDPDSPFRTGLNRTTPPSWGPDDAFPNIIQQFFPDFIQWALAVAGDLGGVRVYSSKSNQLLASNGSWSPGDCWNVCLQAPQYNIYWGAP